MANRENQAGPKGLTTGATVTEETAVLQNATFVYFVDLVHRTPCAANFCEANSRGKLFDIDTATCLTPCGVFKCCCFKLEFDYARKLNL